MEEISQKNEGKRPEEVEVLDASVIIEKKYGLTTIFSTIEYPPAAGHCDILFPDIEDYSKAMEISWDLRKRGTPIGAIDILIASICINKNLKLVTKDRDFENIKSVEPRFRLEIRE